MNPPIWKSYRCLGADWACAAGTRAAVADLAGRTLTGPAPGVDGLPLGQHAPGRGAIHHGVRSSAPLSEGGGDVRFTRLPLAVVVHSAALSKRCRDSRARAANTRHCRRHRADRRCNSVPVEWQQPGGLPLYDASQGLGEGPVLLQQVMMGVAPTGPTGCTGAVQQGAASVFQLAASKCARTYSSGLSPHPHARGAGLPRAPPLCARAH
jgi:hypothetical protein